MTDHQVATGYESLAEAWESFDAALEGMYEHPEHPAVKDFRVQMRLAFYGGAVSAVRLLFEVPEAERKAVRAALTRELDEFVDVDLGSEH